MRLKSFIHYQLFLFQNFDQCYCCDFFHTIDAYVCKVCKFFSKSGFFGLTKNGYIFWRRIIYVVNISLSS